MRITRNPGRVAGFWYLLLIIIGPLRLIYIPSKLFVQGNATATVNNIAARVQIAIPDAVSGRVAGNRRLSLRCLKHGRDTMATISGHGIYDLPARHFLRDSADTVALDQGRQAARGGPHTLIV